ncbi:hypothetical protein Syun_005610 [Stephania yunnanensis]|uniref:Uncharacterized protein n=1 Tax=Stephania yunnanensis TaxID=152371 RepID=A0AAP0Q2F0_9MAGN
MESEHESDSRSHPVSLPEVSTVSVSEGDPHHLGVNEGDVDSSVNIEGDPNAGVKSGSSTPSPSSSSSSSSSSSGSSFDEAFFKDDGNNETKPNAIIDGSSPNAVDDLDIPLKDEKAEIDELYSESSTPSPVSAGAGPSERPAESSQLQIELLTQSPPTQVMERPEEEKASPYRIPSSVFARSKSTTPMEWSVASNESLFSIHMGNNSFSRDHVFLMDRDFGKSGELINSNSSSPPLASPEIERCSDLVEADIVTAAAAETMKEVLRAAAQEHSKEKPGEPVEAHHSPTASRHSDASGASVRSFAFPILTGEGGKSGSAKGDSRHAEKQQSPKSPHSALANAGESKWCFMLDLAGRRKLKKLRGAMSTTAT